MAVASASAASASICVLSSALIESVFSAPRRSASERSTRDLVRGVAGGYQLRAGASLPPLLLEDEEAVAIAVGLRTAAAV